MSNSEVEEFRDEIIIEDVSINLVIIVLMDQKIEGREVVEEGDAVEFSIGDGVDDRVDDGIIEVG